jgi:tRNA threonylcarbamoyladenosine biosynthesis protein TsaE
MHQFISHSEEETATIAREMALAARKGDIIALHGDLGAGKSVFARALIRAMTGQDTDVPSPTFTLLQTYEAPQGTIFHFDLYRIKDAQDVYELGWEDALSEEGIIIIEWPQRLGPLLPRRRTDVTLTPENPHTRKITIDVKTG